MHIKPHHIIILILISWLVISGIGFSIADTDINSAHTEPYDFNNTIGNKDKVDRAGIIFSSLSNKVDTFIWNFEAGPWWSLDKQLVVVKADAILKYLG